jgi:hypothetical protein
MMLRQMHWRAHLLLDPGDRDPFVGAQAADLRDHSTREAAEQRGLALGGGRGGKDPALRESLLNGEKGPLVQFSLVDSFQFTTNRRERNAERRASIQRTTAPTVSLLSQ